MPGYHQAKHRIFRGCQKAVVNRDDPLTIPLLPADVRVISWRMGEPELGGFGLRQRGGGIPLLWFRAMLSCRRSRLQGRHNVANALAALATGSSVGLPLDGMAETLTSLRAAPPL